MDNDVFFVNTAKDLLFFVYDDRRCEVIARIAEKLRPLYEKQYDWVDEVDRENIEKGFGIYVFNKSTKTGSIVPEMGQLTV